MAYKTTANDRNQIVQVGGGKAKLKSKPCFHMSKFAESTTSMYLLLQQFELQARDCRVPSCQDFIYPVLGVGCFAQENYTKFI